MLAGRARQNVDSFLHTISSSADDQDLRTILTNAGAKAGKPYIFRVTIGAVQIGSTSTGTPGLTIGPDSEWPDGSEIHITLNSGAVINGKGGAGGAGSSGTPNCSSAAVAGGAGGKALFVNSSFSRTLKVTVNSGAEINGGGGGGGGGGGARGEDLSGKGCDDCALSASGGTGGTGYGNSAQTSGSAGGTSGSCTPKTAGTGGTGGAKGASGNTGGSGSTAGICTCVNTSGAAGGAAGAAIDGVSKMTLTNNGTINGSQIN